MIILTKVAEKLQSILNGTDTEVGTNGSVVQITNPTDYEFVVQAQGFHLDKIYDENTGKNFIPVFVSSMGGSFNPVPNLKQATYTIPITLYYPIRFKDDFFSLLDFFASAFVGRKLTYGTDKAISNISVAQFGEIQEMDLDQFKEWVEEKYRRAINVHEPFMTMNFTLYLSNADDDYVFGNDITASLSYVLDTTTYTDSSLTFADAALQSHSEPSSEQLLGTSESQSLPSGTSYGASISIMVKNTTFYQKLLQEWFSGNIQTMSFTLTFTFLNQTFTRTVYLQSVNMPMRKGEIVSMTFAFVKKVVLS